MAQTVKELEKERAQLLEAIENQAQQMSSTRSQPSIDEKEHSLKDWLNAAEDIMPSNSTPNNKFRKSKQQPLKSTRKSVDKVERSSFFVAIIIFSLLLILIGGIYLSYASLSNELNTVENTQKKSSQDVELLKEFVVEMEPRIDGIEQTISQLKGEPLASTTEQKNKKVNVFIETKEIEIEQQIKQINKKLDLILLELKGKKTKDNFQEKVADFKIQQPSILVPTEPTIKPLNQPVVKLAKQVTAPKQVKKPTQPLKEYSADVKWLMKQPAFNYTLQLASFNDNAAAQKMIKNTAVAGGRIIHQRYLGGYKYIIVAGSYPTKKQANADARKYKVDYRISPWLRKIKDISIKVN